MTTKLILGAIAGDIIGAPYEFTGMKNNDFPLYNSAVKGINRFTDDTVLTVATMDCLLSKEEQQDYNYTSFYRQYGKKYPSAGYGDSFYGWLYMECPKPYNSFGNGSAMRVSPIGWWFDNMEDVLRESKLSAEVTHNSEEGIRGAQAVATAVFLARTEKSKKILSKYISDKFGFNLNLTCNDIKKNYKYEIRCDKTVPEAIICFLESSDYESAIRLAVSLGGDSDTLAAIAGSIAEAFYGEISQIILDETLQRLPDALKQTIESFSKKINQSTFNPRALENNK
ncbi:hypothetical protein FACS189411_09530 [Bacteroidia bacterium]|nr:hypothetical protein FACS189411_09530 [Bacteroidia bacterium]